MRDLVLRQTLLNRSILPDLYVSLHAADPHVDGRGEAKGGSYIRQLVSLDRSGVGEACNRNVVEYRDLPEVNVSHFGLWDAREGGRFLAGGPLVATQRVFAGQALRWDPEELLVRVP